MPKTQNTRQLAPIRLTWPKRKEGEGHFTDEYEKAYTYGKSIEVKCACHRLLLENQEALLSSPRLSSYEKEQIRSILKEPVGNSRLRNFKEDTQLSYFAHVTRAHATGVPIQEEELSNAKGSHLIFLVTYKGYIGRDADPNHLYIIFYVEKEPAAVAPLQPKKEETLADVHATLAELRATTANINNLLSSLEKLLNK